MTIINNSPFYGATGNLPGFSARSVNTLNNLDSDINIITGNGLSLGVSGSSISLTNTGVRLINGLSGAIDLVAGTAVNFNIVGNTLTINSSDIILPGASYSIGGAGILITQTPGSSAATISNIGVLSYNGITGNIEGVSGAIAGAGISLSAATGAVIISNSGVLSFNGNTGAVAGASLGANTFTGAQTASSGFVGPLTGTASNASALGGTAATDWVLKKDNVASFNGNTGAVVGASLGANTFTLLNTFDAGISASGATFTGNITAPNIVASFNGNTGAVVGASLGANTFTLLNTFNAGISASGATFTGNITAPNIVASFNGVTGAVGISAGSNVTIEKNGNTYTINAILSGSGAATNVANTFTLLNTFAAGISASGATFPGNITISSSGFSGPLGGTASNASALGGTAATDWVLKKDNVASFNGNTGAVAGASLGANVFTLLNTFAAGISATGATFPGNITISSSGFSGPLGGTASNASALGGTAAANWTLKKDSVAKITASTGISITPSGGTGDIYISNSGVQSISAGTGISINQGVGAVTINSTGNFNENILFSGTKQGLVGLYDPTKTQAIWAMGTAYTLGTDTSSASYGTHYGLAWSYEPDYVTAGNNPQSKANLSHQLLLQHNGVTKTAIGIGIWTEGTITARDFNGIVLPASGVAQQIHFGSGGAPALPNSIQFPTVAALPYSIYREGGTWTTPYPDLVISYHTGIKLIAHESYGGTRFYSNYLTGYQSDANILLSVGNGDLHVRVGSSANTTSNLIAYGKVGIGTASPTVALDVAGAIKASTTLSSNSKLIIAPQQFLAAALISTDTTASIVGSSVTAGNFNGTLGLYGTNGLAVGNGGGIMFGGAYDNSNLNLLTAWAEISGVRENSTNGLYDGALVFKTRPSGGNAFERVRITSTGKVGIGVAAPLVALDVVGEARSSTSTISTSDAKTLTTKDYVDTVASNASALGGTASANWTLKKDSVSSFNGLTGAVGGVTTSVANIFTLLNTFNAGISASGATFTGDITAPNIVASFNGNTGAVVGASLGANVFLGINSFTKGLTATTGIFTTSISAPNIVTSFNGLTGAVVGVSLGANTFTGAQTASGFVGPLTGLASNASALGGTASADWTLKKDSVSSFNGLTGAVVGVSLGANTFTGIQTASGFVGPLTGLASSAAVASNASALGGTAAANWTLKKDSVSSFNGVTGAVGISAGSNVTIDKTGNTYTINAILSASGAATNVANTFTLLNTFAAGISATGATFSGNITAPNIVTSFNGKTGAVAGADLSDENTFFGLNIFKAGISAAVIRGDLLGTAAVANLASNSLELGGTYFNLWTLKKDSVSSFNGNTGAVVGASLGANVFTLLNTFAAGISASGATFPGNITISSSGFSGPLGGTASNASALGGTAAANWTLKKDSVSSFNGVTGAVGISAGSNVTIDKTGNTYTINAILSGFGAATNVANTFTLLNTFAAGISASGATFSGNITATGATFGSLAVTGQSNFGGAVTINGNLLVGGTMTTVSVASTTVAMRDTILALGATGGGAGITGDSFNDRGVAFFYNNTPSDTEGVSCGFFGMDITSKNFVYYQYGGTAGVGSAGGFTGTIEANFKGATATFDKLVVVSSINATSATFTGNITAPNIVTSFNGNTGAVVGASLGANVFTLLNTFAAGISATGATFPGNITISSSGFSGPLGGTASNASALGGTAAANWTLKKDSVASFNGNTGAVVGASLGANTFTLLNTFDAGISATGATFPGNITISSSGFSGPLGGTASNASALGGTLAADWTLKKDSVSSFNGKTGAVAGASLGANVFLGINSFTKGLTATTGIFTTSISAPNIVTSFNGNTGAVVGASLGANTFTGLNTFAAGISANTILSESYKVSKDAVNIQTATSYALQMSDNGKIITCNNASPITVTLPTAVDNTRFTCTVIQLGDGVVEFAVASANETMTSYLGKTKLAGKYASAIILNIASSTSSKQYVITGNLSY